MGQLAFWDGKLQSYRINEIEIHVWRQLSAKTLLKMIHLPHDWPGPRNENFAIDSKPVPELKFQQEPCYRNLHQRLWSVESFLLL